MNSATLNNSECLSNNTVLFTMYVMSCLFVYFQKKSLGQELYEQVFYHLDLVEKDYFGLQYTDHTNVSVSMPHYLRWMVHPVDVPLWYTTAISPR